MKNLGLFGLALILSVFLGLLGVKVILSVSTLFGLTFIAELGFLKLYGLLAIVHLVLYKDKDSEDILNGEEKIKKLFTQILSKCLTYLFFWGLMFLIYGILK